MNDKIADILSVLQKIKTAFEESHGSADITKIRREAIKSVANEQLTRNRFVDFDSAKKSIHDACVRRLKPAISKVAQFDQVITMWLCSDSCDLKTIILKNASTQFNARKIEQFFASC